MAPLGAVLTLALAAAGLVAADPPTEKCGAADYLPTENICYNNKTLCPIINSLPLSHCAGTGGCYAPQQFSCGEDGVLRTLPKTTKPFTLTAWGTRSAYRGQEVRACGNYLAIGANARACTACPKDAGVDCKKYGGKTVLWPDGKMATDVPGHQYWYIHPSNGVLMYTSPLPVSAPAAPSNATAPTWSNTTVTAPVDERPEVEWSGRGGITVYENGFFVADGAPHYFKACLRTHAGGGVGTGRAWRLYATSNWVALDADCEPIKLVATPVEATAGAYEYH